MTREELAEIDRINAITMHAARALFLEMFAPLINPNGLATQILRLAGNAPDPRADIRIQKAIGKQTKMLVEDVEPGKDGEGEPLIFARVKRLAAKRSDGAAANRKADALAAGDPRGVADWRAELLSWALAHNGLLNLDEYREQKFLIDYPNMTTGRTRISQSVHDSLKKKYTERIGHRLYRITPAGEEYMRGLNATIPNTPTPAPQPPPPIDFVPPEVSEDREETEERITAPPKQRKGRAAGNTTGEPLPSEAIREAVLKSPDHTLNINTFRKDYEKRWGKRPMSMDGRIRSAAKNLVFSGFMRRVKPDVFRMSEEQEQLPPPASSAASA